MDDLDRISKTVELIPLFGRSHGPRQTMTITLPRVRFLETPAAATADGTSTVVPFPQAAAPKVTGDV